MIKKNELVCDIKIGELKNFYYFNRQVKLKAFVPIPWLVTPTMPYSCWENQYPFNEPRHSDTFN